MKLSHKLLFSIPTILSIFYMSTFWFPENFTWLFPTMEAYYSITAIVNLSVIVQAILLIRKLRSLKNINRSIRTNWIWLLILFNQISTPILIWKKLDEYNKLNDSLKIEN